MKTFLNRTESPGRTAAPGPPPRSSTLRRKLASPPASDRRTSVTSISDRSASRVGPPAISATSRTGTAPTIG